MVPEGNLRVSEHHETAAKTGACNQLMNEAVIQMAASSRPAGGGEGLLIAARWGGRCEGFSMAAVTSGGARVLRDLRWDC